MPLRSKRRLIPTKDWNSRAKKRLSSHTLVSRLLFGYDVTNVHECIARYNGISKESWISSRRAAHPWSNTKKRKHHRVKVDVPHRSKKLNFCQLCPVVLGIVSHFAPKVHVPRSDAMEEVCTQPQTSTETLSSEKNTRHVEHYFSHLARYGN